MTWAKTRRLDRKVNPPRTWAGKGKTGTQWGLKKCLPDLGDIEPEERHSPGGGDGTKTRSLNRRTTIQRRL